MNKYSKKKSLWKAMCELQSGPIYVALIIMIFAILYVIGFIEKHTLGFSVFRFLLGEIYTINNGAIDTILTGFVTITTIVISASVSYYLTLHQILKMLAIVRYCRLPLTEEEIKLGIETGDFSSLSTYLAYLNKQMNYGIYCLYFTKPEIKLAINNGINVFKPRDDEYFELPECIYTTLMEIYDEENLGCLTTNGGMFVLHNSIAEKTNIPVTKSCWGLYGKIYKEKADTYFEEE